MKLPRLVLTTLLLSMLGSMHAGAQAPALAEALRNCLSHTDNLDRLTCYDDLARQQPAAGAAPMAVIPAPAAPALAVDERKPTATSMEVTSQGTAVAAFGQPVARVEAGPEGTEALVDTVVEAKRAEPTKWLLTLASGQVWRQSVGKSYLIRPGDTVRISPTSWGSDYRLSVEGRRGYIQVTRQE